MPNKFIRKCYILTGNFFLVPELEKQESTLVSKLARQVTQEMIAVKQFSAMPTHSLNISQSWNSNCIRNSTFNLISEMILPVRT